MATNLFQLTPAIYQAVQITNGIELSDLAFLPEKHMPTIEKLSTGTICVFVFDEVGSRFFVPAPNYLVLEDGGRLFGLNKNVFEKMFKKVD